MASFIQPQFAALTLQKVSVGAGFVQLGFPVYCYKHEQTKILCRPDIDIIRVRLCRLGVYRHQFGSASVDARAATNPLLAVSTRRHVRRALLCRVVRQFLCLQSYKN